MITGYINNLFTTSKTLEEVEYPFLKDKPTLIVGWKNAKSKFPEMSLRNWQIDENTYWTLEAEEDRMKQEEDLKKFEKLCLERFLEQFSFTYLDLLLEPTPVLDLKSDTKILLSNCLLYIKDLKSIRYMSIELCSIMGFDPFLEISAANLTVETSVENKLGVEDKFLICFL